MPAAAAHGAPPPSPIPRTCTVHAAPRGTRRTQPTQRGSRVSAGAGHVAQAQAQHAQAAQAAPQGVPLQGWDAAPGRPGARGRARSAPPPRAVISKAQRTAGHDPRAMFLCFILNLPTAETVRGVETSRISLSVQCGLSLPGRLRSSARQLDSVPQLPSTGELRTPRWTSHLWLARCVTPAHSQKRVLTTAHVSARVSSSSRVVGRSRRAAIAPLTLYCTLLAALSWRSKTGRRHSSASSPWPPPPPLPFLCCRCGCRWSPWSY
jgi:hypothetical protein